MLSPLPSGSSAPRLAAPPSLQRHRHCNHPSSKRPPSPRHPSDPSARAPLPSPRRTAFLFSPRRTAPRLLPLGRRSALVWPCALVNAGTDVAVAVAVAAHGLHYMYLFVMGAAVPGLHSPSPALISKPSAAVASRVRSGRSWPRLPLRRGDVGGSYSVKWTGRAGRARHCPPVCSSATVPTRLSDAPVPSHGGEEVVTQSRRSIVQTGAALALLAVLNPSAVLAETAQSDPEAAASQESVQAEAKAEKSRVDMESWYRVRGEGFAMSVPPNYEDIVEYDDSGNSLYGERAKEKPFLARFASPDRKEVLSVVARNSTQLKLSFLQTQDITEFGTLEEAARIFVPAGSKIVAAATRKPTDSRVPRTYYLYEFLAKDDKRVVMSAAAAGGTVFVFGAMAPNSRWKEIGSTMRSAALNFALR